MIWFLNYDLKYFCLIASIYYEKRTNLFKAALPYFFHIFITAQLQVQKVLSLFRKIHLRKKHHILAFSENDECFVPISESYTRGKVNVCLRKWVSRNFLLGKSSEVHRNPNLLRWSFANISARVRLVWKVHLKILHLCWMEHFHYCPL